MIEEMKQKIIISKSSNANKVEVIHGSLFVTFTPGL